MKVALVYDPSDRKLQEASYSQVYREQFLALQDIFPDARHITSNCSAKDIEAEAVIFYDVHSSHNIKIDGIQNHKSVKYEYMNDPHQITCGGFYLGSGQKFFKRGAGLRMKRAHDRGIDYIICPYKDGAYRFLAPYGDMDKMLLWMPVAPAKFDVPKRKRKQAVLANGCTWSYSWFECYKFRKWAYSQSEVEYVEHCIKKSETPSCSDYMNWLSSYSAALAICDTYVVPKYLQIPLAGCVCFAQELDEYKSMGFRDGIECVYVNKHNFKDRIRDFLAHPMNYCEIAKKGRLLVNKKWTADKFAGRLHDHIKSCLLVGAATD